MPHDRSRELGVTIRRLLKRATGDDRSPRNRGPLNLAPRTAFEALLSQQINALEKQMEELRGRINNLFLLVIGSVALQAVLRVAGF